jgi:hypothetical protein
VLIVHGDDDTNAPLGQANYFHRALSRFGAELAGQVAGCCYPITGQVLDSSPSAARSGKELDRGGQGVTNVERLGQLAFDLIPQRLAEVVLPAALAVTADYWRRRRVSVGPY